MKKLLSLMAVLFLFVTTNVQAQDKKYSIYAVGFYNLENLFDTLHDVGHNDYEYLPDGRNKWGTMKYWKAQIFRRDYLFQQEGRYKGNTLRTHSRGIWLDGYSDHLPTVVYLVKEIK